MNTLTQYQAQQARCRELFAKKTQDYGTAWRILRLSSLTDQLWIKAKRIRSIEEKGEQKIADSVENEYIALVNYSLIALIQLELGEKTSETAGLELGMETALNLYTQAAQSTEKLMLDKNHDYGEAWREMRISSLTDLILMKLLRVKQIEELNGQTQISEGVDANYQDIINYSLFALIRLQK